MSALTEEIKSKINIEDFVQEYVKLTKAGTNYKALCPFHKEKSPSFMVSSAKQIWHCFGCGKGGDHFTFYQEMENVGFREALTYLAEKAGVDMTKYDQYKGRSGGGQYANSDYREKLFKMNTLAKDLYKWILWEQQERTEPILKYLRDRGLKDETLKEYEIGFIPNSWRNLINFLKKKKFTDQDIRQSGLVVTKEGTSNYYDRFRGRIMVPLKDMQGRVVGFSGRVFSEDGEDSKGAKYVNTTNTAVYNKSKVLYNLDKAKGEIKSNDKCLILEGQFDVIASVQAGIEYAIAPCGTALTPDHLNLIKRYTSNVILCFDSDSAGITATERSYVLATLSQGLNIKIIKLPNGKDPADVACKDPADWKNLVEKAIDIIDYSFAVNFERFDSKTIDGKKQIAEKIMPLLMRIDNPIEKAEQIERLANDLKLDLDVLLESYKKQQNEGVYDSENSYRQTTQTEGKFNIDSRAQFLVKKVIAMYIVHLSADKDIEKRLLNLEVPEGKLKELYDYALGKSEVKDEVKQSELDQELTKITSYEIRDEQADLLKSEFDTMFSELEILVRQSRKNQIEKKIEEAEAKGDDKELNKLFEELANL